ncbi:MAG: carbamoyltransferase HypF, partial [Firmicutes bacterium]|nr:carbamoyltransferase HypF [Bacillota bacterium]
CRREIFDPGDRHYRYPFTNCTNCGPRYTIVRDLPYDRPLTAMAEFALCPECAREYHDPADRRFDAQPVACPACGPEVWLATPEGRRLEEDWLDAFREAIARGEVVALKGLGGFHLACDARNEEAVARLRRRKHRPAKPFAVMVRDLATARRYVELDAEEEALLASPEAPILLARKTEAARRELAPSLAPGLQTLGVMLPYTPLHLLLLAEGPEVLVMTSGNLSGLPLEFENEGALERLGGVADRFLLHNRTIVNRADDSVVRRVAGRTQIQRRSRGYVPRPLPLRGAAAEGPAALGAGGEMKNAFCLLRGAEAYAGPHVGEMESLEAEEAWRLALDRFQRLLSLRPEVVGVDAHPGYRISRLAREFAREQGAGVVPIQHHHAHLVAALAEAGLEGPALGAVMDGTGYGTDGRIWGWEVLWGDASGFERLGHLRYVPMPGGEAAVREPWRMAVSHLWDAFGPDRGGRLARHLLDLPAAKLEALEALEVSGLNAPLTSSAGRLFDAVSALLGLARVNTYEGQAAIELGEAAERAVRAGYRPRSYPFALEPGDGRDGDGEGGRLRFDLRPALRELVQRRLEGAPAERLAADFHETVAAALTEALGRWAEARGVDRVVLTGGSMQNPLLLERAEQLLRGRGIGVVTPVQLPPNDGGLGLGQAVIARRRWVEDVSGGTR